MKQILLFTETKKENFEYDQIYMCVINRNYDQDKYLAKLSLQVMTWKPEVSLVKMSLCLYYWQTIAANNNFPCHKLWKDIINKIVGSGSYYGALSFHP